MNGMRLLWDELASNFTGENRTEQIRNPSFPDVYVSPSKFMHSVTGWVPWEADSGEGT